MNTTTAKRTWHSFISNIWEGMGSIFNSQPEYPTRQYWRTGFSRDRVNLQGDMRRVFNDLESAVKKCGDKAR